MQGGGQYHQTPSTGLRHTSFLEEGAEGDARSVQYHLCRPVGAKLAEGPKLDGLLKIQT